MDFISMIQGARLPRPPKGKTDCPLGTECLLRDFQSVITQCLHQISNALWFRWLQKSPIMETFST